MGGSLIVIVVLGGLVVLVLLWGVVTYNRLVGLRSHIRDAWAGIDVELKRRYDLIPNLVETVKGYASHERETLDAVIRARNQAMANNGPADSQAKDEQQLVGALRQLAVVVEQYPQLKADTGFGQLQGQLSETEDRIAAARRFYNGNVRTFNQLTRMVPSNFIASSFGFGPEPYFELEDPAQRVAPKVDFSTR